MSQSAEIVWYSDSYSVPLMNAIIVVRTGGFRAQSSHLCLGGRGRLHTGEESIGPPVKDREELVGIESYEQEKSTAE